eukprot:TRINITY_DN21264_c0_g1_i4.p1 TRINITY_DN21264_c0_g1~~TRINITY_DN21264_c0_g1_i4.p1  ORF type:complete len:515 (+),score=125.78 TRINITY_DN21264_c0_g1_i4:41-1546(+)
MSTGVPESDPPPEAGETGGTGEAVEAGEVGAADGDVPADAAPPEATSPAAADDDSVPGSPALDGTASGLQGPCDASLAVTQRSHPESLRPADDARSRRSVSAASASLREVRSRRSSGVALGEGARSRRSSGALGESVRTPRIEAAAWGESVRTPQIEIAPASEPAADELPVTPPREYLDAGPAEKDDAAELRQELTEARARLSALDEQVRRAEARTVQVEKQNESLQRLLAARDSDAKVKLLNEELQRRAARIKSLEQDVREALQRAQVAEAAATRSASAQDTEVQKLRKSLEKAKAEASQLRESKRRAESVVSSSSAAMQKLRGDLAESEEMRCQLESRLHRAQEAIVTSAGSGSGSDFRLQRARAAVECMLQVSGARREAHAKQQQLRLSKSGGTEPPRSTHAHLHADPDLSVTSATLPQSRAGAAVGLAQHDPSPDSQRVPAMLTPRNLGPAPSWFPLQQTAGARQHTMLTERAPVSPALMSPPPSLVAHGASFGFAQ